MLTWLSNTYQIVRFGLRLGQIMVHVDVHQEDECSCVYLHKPARLWLL